MGGYRWQNSEENVIIAPRELVNAGQRALFGCKDDEGQCKVRT